MVTLNCQWSFQSTESESYDVFDVYTGVLKFRALETFCHRMTIWPLQFAPNN